MEIKLSKKTKLKKILDFLLNPKLLLCLFIAWMITNGWSYLFIAFGTLYNIKWMLAFGSAYFAFLWFPFTPEKVITVAIAILLLKVFFPNDKRTLAVLKRMYYKVKNRKKNKRGIYMYIKFFDEITDNDNAGGKGKSLAKLNQARV